MPQIFGKIRNVKSSLPEGHSLFGQNVDDYPRHHFIFPVMSPPPESWGLQVQFAGRDEFIYGCWRERRNSLTFALEFVREGVFEYIANGQRYECHPGDLFIVHPGADERMSVLTEYGMKYTVSMVGSSLMSLLNSLNLMSVAQFRVRSEQKVAGMYEELFALLERRPAGFANELSVRAYALLLELSSDLGSGEYPEQLLRIVNFIKENFNQPLTIDGLCGEFGISSGSLFRLFRTHIGKAPIDFMIEERMRAARSFLLESRAPIKTIAYRVGYASQLYFSAEFRRVCGMSPRDYRKKNMQM